MYKKILYVTPLYPSHEKKHYCIFIQQQIKELIKLGNYVEVIVPRYTKLKRINVEETHLDEIKITYIDFPVFYYGLFSNILIKIFISKIQKIIDFSEYDFISIHMFEEHLLKSFIKISKYKNVKICAHYHGLNVGYNKEISLITSLLQHKGNRVYKKLLKEVDGIIGVSNKVCNEIKKLYNLDATTIYNGVDNDIFYPSLQKKEKRDEVIIVCVGNLIKTKGQEFLIEAFYTLVNNYKQMKISLKIIGEGPMSFTLRKIVEQYNLSNCVEFTGSLGYGEVAEIMRDSDIFVLPSYYEALGCVYLEAMATKLPTIGCIDQGIAEIIVDKKNGILINTQDSQSLFKALEYLIENEKERNRISKNGYEDVLQKYTWKISAEKMNVLLEKI